MLALASPRSGRILCIFLFTTFCPVWIFAHLNLVLLENREAPDFTGLQTEAFVFQSGMNAPVVIVEDTSVCLGVSQVEIPLRIEGTADEYELKPAGDAVGVFPGTDGFVSLDAPRIMLTIQQASAGAYDFEVRVRSSGQPGLISDAAAFSLFIREGPDFMIKGDSRLCPGEDFSLQLSGNEATTFEWSGAAALGIPDGSAEGPEKIIGGKSGGNRSGENLEAVLRIKAFDEQGCMVEKSRTAVIFSEPVVSDVRISACPGLPFEVNLDDLISNGIDSEYEWILDPLPPGLAKTDVASPSTGITEHFLRGSFVRIGGGNTVFTATYLVVPVSETGACTGTPFTVAVDVPPAPFGENSARSICSGQSTGIELTTAPGSFPADRFDVELLTKTNNITGAATEGGDLSPAAIKSDTYFNRSETPGSVTYRITPVSTTGCRGESFEKTVRVLPDPKIGSALRITGVDFPSSGTCGHFNVILQLSVENTGPVALRDIQALLDLSAPNAFGAAFQGIVPGGGPQIVESNAMSDPVLDAAYDGRGALLVGNTGMLAPGQGFTLQLTAEVFPQAAGAPSFPLAQALVGGLTDYTGLTDDLSGLISCRAEDLSDSGDDPAGDNPDAPGDSETNDDPTPLGDCHLRVQQTALKDRIALATDENCRTRVTPELMIENYQPDCDTSALPLGGYYRIFYLGEEVTGPVEVDGVIGGLLVFEVRTVNSCEPVRGFVTPEDQAPPSLNCPRDVSGLIRYDNGQQEGFAFRPASGPSQAGNGEVFNYLLCTELDSIYRNDRSWRDAQYAYFTGMPVARDNCGTARIVDMQEELIDLSCSGETTMGGQELNYQIERTFVFEDDNGNRSSCVQTISFFRPHIFLPDCRLELNTCFYGGADTDLSPSRLGSAPFFITAAGDTLLLTEEETCGFSVAYEDQYVQGPGECEEKTIRTWMLDDACRQTDAGQWPVGKNGGYNDCPAPPSSQEGSLVYEQHLITGDVAPPLVRCTAGNDIQTAGLVFTAELINCEATVSPPPPVVEGECGAWDWTFELYGEVYDPATGATSYERIGLAENKQLPGVPVGRYDLFYFVEDACGNTAIMETPCTVLVRDAVSPVARCHEQLEISIGVTGIGGLSVEEVDMNSWDNCGRVERRVRRTLGTDCLDDYVAVKSAGKKFEELTAVENDQNNLTEYYDGDQLVLSLENGVFYSTWSGELLFTCCDAGGEVSIELRVSDGGGNTDLCETSVIAKDVPGGCAGMQDGEGGITGSITTVTGKAMTSVQVELSGTGNALTSTDDTGSYRFAYLSAGGSYTVRPHLDDNPRNGVSTLDLLLTSKHILGVERLESPYALIAADANASGSVTTLDLIQLRKVILGIEPEFPNNPSWRFVRRDFTFTDPQAPWGELDEASMIRIEQLDGIVTEADFIGVKIGDLNASATAGAFQPIDERDVAGVFRLSATGERFSAGETDTVDFYAAGLDSVEGFQFTLELEAGTVELVEVIPGIAEAHHFGYFPAEGRITLSWIADNYPDKRSPGQGQDLPGLPRVKKDGANGQPPTADRPLFRLVLRAKSDLEMEEAFYLSSRIAVAEAYRADGVLLVLDLDYLYSAPGTGPVMLYQNRPNPFREKTLIDFVLPEAGEASLQVRDIKGRLLYSNRAVYAAGRHQIEVDKSRLAPGVLFYTLKTLKRTLTRRMILVE